MTKVLAVASEVFPLIKTGGLADVVGALPEALRDHDVDIRVLVPGYPSVIAALKSPDVVYRVKDLFGGAARLLAGKSGVLDLFVLDAPHLYDRSGNPYLGPDGRDWPDNWKRFAALSLVANDIGRGAIAAFVPEIVHAHDWQAALSAVYLRTGVATKTKVIVTVHNLAFQGNFPATIFASLRLPAKAFAIDGIEYYGGVSYLKGGLQFADAITTVSPTYADEICSPAGGMGLDGLLRARHSLLSGIVNGIDTDVWNPESDANIAANYTAAKLSLRATNKRQVEKRFGLEAGDGMIFSVISRLAWQKGMDLLGECIDGLVGAGARLAVLGSGDAALEGLFRSATARHRGRVGVVTGYDEPLAHLLQAGADAILVPSRFEPCGLTQFCGLRYGCVPVVSRVGGLADTIIEANDAAISAGVATGIQFSPVETPALQSAINRTLSLYGDRKTWQTMQKRGMRADVSWRKSAGRYATLYASLANK
jgi:starch synthase